MGHLQANGTNYLLRPTPCPNRMALGVDGLRKERLRVIWGLRFLLLRALLVNGISVLQCDVDALLLKNPLPVLNSISGDIVAQRGTFPFRIKASWGATLCFGVILYRPTIATLAWFELSLPLFYDAGDDQSEFQRALDMCSLIVWNHGITWPATRELHLSLKPKPVLTNKTDFGVTLLPITTGGTRLNVTMLPTNMFPRKCGNEPNGIQGPHKDPNVVIVHCVTPKGKGSDKAKYNHKLNMTFLRWVFSALSGSCNFAKLTRSTD